MRNLESLGGGEGGGYTYYSIYLKKRENNAYKRESLKDV